MGPEGEAPKGGAPKGGAPKGGDPKFRVFFFSLSRHSFLFFFPSLLVFFVEFWWCLKRRGAQMCTFGVLGLLCEAPAAPKPHGLHTTTREPKRAHFRVPAFKNTTKIQREDTQRGKKRTNFAAGEEKKKSEILGGPGEGRSREGRFRQSRQDLGIPFNPKKRKATLGKSARSFTARVPYWLSTNWAEYFAKDREPPTSSPSSQWSSTSWWGPHSWSSNWQGWHQHSWQDDQWLEQR